MNKQPNSRHCFVCGVENPIGLHLKFYETRAGEINAEFTAPEYFQGYPGVLHGGIAASILDEAAGRVHMGIFPPRFMFTAKLEVRYRKNIPVGQLLNIVGRAGKNKGRMAEGWAGIFSAGGVLLAEANALLVDVPNALDPVDFETLGWKIYPD